MHAQTLLHKLLSKQCSNIHATRLNTFLAAVHALTHGAHATVTSLGRGYPNRFLDQLAGMMPEKCCPIVVADSGFKTQFYRYVESRLKWHWVGRIRGQDFLSWQNQWFSAKSLYSKAANIRRQRQPSMLGLVRWTQRNPFAAFIVLVRQSKKNRQSLTLAGRRRRSKHNQAQASREKEPWLLVASSLYQRSAKQVVKIYRTRMQIEEGFRDCKSAKYGLGLSSNRRVNQARWPILCLLTALAIFVLWCIWDAVLQLKGSETIEFQTFKLGAGVLFARNTPATAGLPWWCIET